jgi:hypothetical protein
MKMVFEILRSEIFSPSKSNSNVVCLNDLSVTALKDVFISAER